MDKRDRIVTAFERSRRALELRPSVGQGTATTRATLVEGMTCRVDDGDWTFTVDMPEKHGGADRGPNPGVYGRAALASCLAVGYARWAAVLDVPLERLEVVVDADYDAGGEFGTASSRPGYQAMRYRVVVESPASEERVLEMLDRADAHSSFLDDFRNPVPVERTVELRAPSAMETPARP